MKDPFEAALVEEQESPPDSPVPPEGEAPAANEEEPEPGSQPSPSVVPAPPSTSAAVTAATAAAAGGAVGGGGNTGRGKEDEEEEDEEENMDVELGRITSGDPHKMEKMQAILSQFTQEQMSRYESFRRSGFQKSNMKKLLVSITGSQKISVPMTIVVSGIAKMFVGELVETARLVMTERKDHGPIRPCHIREAYRRLKLEGKIFKRPVSRLFH